MGSRWVVSWNRTLFLDDMSCSPGGEDMDFLEIVLGKEVSIPGNQTRCLILRRGFPSQGQASIEKTTRCAYSSHLAREERN